MKRHLTGSILGATEKVSPRKCQKPRRVPIVIKNHRILTTLNIISIIFDPNNQVSLNFIKPQNVGFAEACPSLKTKSGDDRSHRR
ncbi:hypothetical protein [Prosthecobacter algae]|uniref:hypothetical protein n=1 Tax=Prosthecobacter algae TaxID=1144682 RepID=UPI0031EB469D